MISLFCVQRFNAKYRCKKCSETWKSKNTSHLKMICKNRDCRKIVRAYKFEVTEHHVIMIELLIKACVIGHQQTGCV